jgi:Xaa-Pro aminopeptidase
MFETQVYTDRRKRLSAKMDKGIALFPGNNESPMNYPANGYHFRQDSSFLYYFGLDMPGLVGWIDFENGKEIIFGNDVDMDDIIWMGPQPAMRDRAAKAGVSHTEPLARLSEYLNEAIRLGRKIHFLPPYRADLKIWLADLLGLKVCRLAEYASRELILNVIAQRNIKDQYEIAQLEEAAAIGYLMHTTAMKMARDGVREQDIAGVIEGIALAHGGGSVSFPIILSKNGQTLHNHDHSNILRNGDLMLVDCGAESSLHYASDNTRTSPVGGKFSTRQREVYQIVVDAVDKVSAGIRPGMPYKELHLEAARVITSGLKALGLMKGDVEEAVQNGAHALFFPHGLGHMMGLDVHDMENLGENLVGYDAEIKRSTQFGTAYLRLGRKLEEGYVLTNEPGIYFIPALIDKWQADGTNKDFIDFEKVNAYRDFGGIRLEDDLLVTADGGKLIGERIPIYPDEVEAFMRE